MEEGGGVGGHAHNARLNVVPRSPTARNFSYRQSEILVRDYSRLLKTANHESRKSIFEFHSSQKTT